MVPRASRTFTFGPFVLLPEQQILLRGEETVRLGGRALELLTVLVERPGELVSKSELLERVWPGTSVDESNLKVNMAAVRRVLETGPEALQYIATVVGRGYRFVAPVQVKGGVELLVAARKPLAPNHNLPISTTRIFGRAEAIASIRRDLEQARLVSIVGAGGVGKTTVALAVAEQSFESFHDGVWLVDLATLADADRAPSAVAAVLGLEAHSSDSARVDVRRSRLGLHASLGAMVDATGSALRGPQRTRSLTSHSPSHAPLAGSHDCSARRRDVFLVCCRAPRARRDGPTVERRFTTAHTV